MRRLASVVLLAAALAPNLAPAQSGLPPGNTTPDKKSGEIQAPPRSTIEDLLDRLSKSKDEDEAKGIAQLIERRWARSGSDTADLLMSRATEAVHAKDYPLAVELLDRILVLQPGWAEAWYRRASVFHLMDDPASAMADIREALRREPRHFSAWTGLGHILMASDDKPRALEAYRRALKIHPQLSNLQAIVERLTLQIDGHDL
jgi:tetratricopeptide (TPR) repeat protein